MVKREVAQEESITKAAEKVLGSVQQLMVVAEQQVEETVAPVRKSVIKRFPVLFLLMVTFGFTVTVTGLEQLLVQYDFLGQHPGVILFIGICILTIAGTLYKKLG